MTIKRLKYRIPHGVPYRIEAALLVFGVNVKVRYSRTIRRLYHHGATKSFWRLHGPDKLYSFLERAKRVHRQLIQRVHPDRGGCPKLAAFINAVWDRIQLLFKRRGYELCA